MTVDPNPVRRPADPQITSRWTPQQWQIFNAFHDSAYVRDQMDVQTGRLWDSVKFAAGATITTKNSELFTNVGASSGKRITDSNMNRPRELIAPEAFSIQRVIFTFNTDALNEDVYAFAESAMFSLWIGQKYFLRDVLISMHTAYAAIAPLRICQYCSGVYVANSRCPGCGASEFKLSDIGCTEEAPGRQFFMDVSPPIVLLARAPFYVDFVLEPYTCKGPLKIWCHFEGLHARGVC